MAIARADTRTAAKPTAGQMRVLMMLEQLAGAADWRGVAAQERAAMAVAAAVRTSMPNYASFVYSALGSAYQNLGSFSKALEHHKGHLTMAKEVGDRTGEGMAYGNLCNGYQSQGDRCQGMLCFEVGDGFDVLVQVHVAIAKVSEPPGPLPPGRPPLLQSPGAACGT